MNRSLSNDTCYLLNIFVDIYYLLKIAFCVLNVSTEDNIDITEHSSVGVCEECVYSTVQYCYCYCAIVYIQVNKIFYRSKLYW